MFWSSSGLEFKFQTASAANSGLRRAQSQALSQDRGPKEEQERYRLKTPSSGSIEATTQISTHEATPATSTIVNSI